MEHRRYDCRLALHNTVPKLHNNGPLHHKFSTEHSLFDV